MEADIKIFDTVDSTNITLSGMAAEGAPEGTCVVAFCQKAGQGRSGRSFYSPPGGNLYMSLLLKPSDRTVFDMITVYAAVSVVQAIGDMLGVRCGIKWVNDIYRGSRKVCGIVAQAHNYGSADEYVILGIGINIYEDENVPAGISKRYGSVTGRSCDIPEDAAKEQAVVLARRIISCFSYYYDGVKNAEAVVRYREGSIVTGKTVEYISGEEVRIAKVAGIDDNAGIMLEIDGETKTYRDGEIRIRLTDT